VYLIEPDLQSGGPGGRGADLAGAHDMTPEAAFDLVKSLGGSPGQVLIVG
jgi:hypothetical protein